MWIWGSSTLPSAKKNGFRSSYPHPKNTCGFPSPATHKTCIGFVFFSFTTHKVYEFHFPQHHDLKICAPPYPNTILLLFLSATRRLNLKYVSLPPIPNQKRFLSAPRLKIHICFVPLMISFTTRNILILSSASLHQKYADFIFLSLVDQKSSGLVVRFPQPQESKTIHVLFPLVSRHKMFQSFPQPVCTKNMQISFPSPLSTKIICATLPSASGFKNHTCFCFS